MFFKTCATLALATAAAAGPILAPRVPQDLPAYRRSVDVARDGNGRGGNNNNNNAFNLIDGFQNFNNQNTVIQVQKENTAVIKNGNNVRVIQESVNQVLVVDQQNNRNNRDMNNLFRKSNFRNNNRDQTTVLLVVTEVQIRVDDGRGNQVDQRVFAQSAVVANRGQRRTETVMIFEARTLIQQDIIGNNRGNNNNNNNNNKSDGGRGNQGFAAPTQASAPQQTADVQLFDQKPTWSSVAADPAETLGAIWEAELKDAQDAGNNAADNQQNQAAADQENKALEEAVATASNATAVAQATSSAAVEATASAAAEATSSAAPAETVAATSVATSEAAAATSEAAAVV